MIQEQLTMAIAVGMMIVMMAIGYIAGRLTRIERIYGNMQLPRDSVYTASKQKYSQDADNKLDTIKIDDRKFVIDINTGGIEKKYGELGETKVSDENISSSVNKLKGMKK